MGYLWADGGYSSDVDICLVVDGKQYAVAQVGPHSLILRDNISVPSGHAQIIVTIDGRREVHDVIIGSGVPADNELVFS